MPSVAETPLRRQANPVSAVDRDEGKDRSLIRQLAIDESGWKHEAVAEALGLTNAAYLSQMLSGEKAIGAKHLAALPDDVEAIFARRYAESFGLIVVAPAESRDEAVRHLVRGLFGVLAPMPPLPARATQMAKAAMERRSGQDRRKVG